MDPELPDLTKRFGWPDYLVFAAMLMISAIIGVYYGCFGGKQKTTDEFLMGNRQMGTFPMAMSLLASFVSAVGLLGIPAEIYNFGTLYWLCALSNFLVIPMVAYCYMPVFFNLQLTSAYEYLQLRFNHTIRLIGSLLFTLQMVLYMAVVVYAPALALSQVTGINTYLAVTTVFAVCIFYTSLGGMKAVMWTDTFQTIVMYGSIIAVIVKGSYDVGGVSVVWEKSFESDRLELFNFNINPTTRHTFWWVVIGCSFLMLSVYAVNQAQVQRYLTVPSIEKARNALWFNAVGLLGVLTLCCYAGLVIYTKYADCDPLSTRLIKSSDQLFPLFVMDTLGAIPGIPGLFVAGIFSAALSTLSSGLNSLAAIFLEDIIKDTWKLEMSDEKQAKVSKLLAVLYGLLSYALVFAVENFGGVLQAAISIFGITGGPVLGVFTLGMFFPCANSKGALVGTLAGLALTCWSGFGSQVAASRHQIIHPKKPVAVDGCMYNYTLIEPPVNTLGEPFPLYKISYLLFAPLGFLAVLLVGVVVSYLTGGKDPNELNPKLLSPIVRKHCPSMSCRKSQQRETDLPEAKVRRKGLDKNGQENKAYESYPEHENTIVTGL